MIAPVPNTDTTPMKRPSVDCRRIVAFTSASDYSGDFGWHDTEVSAWILDRLVHNDRKTIEAAVGGGYAWVANDIGRSRGWIGVQVKLSR